MLVLNGFPLDQGIHSEVIDIQNEDLICTDLNDAPYEMERGTGGFIENHLNYVLICGGEEKPEGDTNKCWSKTLNIGKKQTFTMKYKRNYASSIIINSNDRLNDMVSNLLNFK